MIPARTPRRSPLIWLCLALVLVPAAVRVTLPLRDGDLWFHLAYARAMLEQGSLVVDHRLFSWTPASNAAIYCTWLADLLLYLCHRTGGLNLVLGLRYLAALLFLAALIHLAARRGRLARPETWLAALCGLYMADAGLMGKPELFSLAGTILACWNLWHIREEPRQRAWMWYLYPLLMLVWVNCHGGVVFGHALLGAIWLGETMNRLLLPEAALPRSSRRHLRLALLLSLGTLFCTPYGYHYPLQLARDLLPSAANLEYNSFITAYRSPLRPLPGRLDLADLANLGLALLLGALVPMMRARKADGLFLVPVLLFGLLYTQFYRTTYFWAPVLCLALVAAPRLPGGYAWPLVRGRTRQVLALVLLAGLGLAGMREALCHPQPYCYIGLGPGNGSPLHEADYIATHLAGQRIANTYNQGSYLLWRLYPARRVMIDSRHFPFRAWSRDFFAFARNPLDHQDFLRRFPAPVWVVGLHRPALLRWFLRQPGWTLAFYGNNAAVMVNRGRETEDRWGRETGSRGPETGDRGRAPAHPDQVRALHRAPDVRAAPAAREMSASIRNLYTALTVFRLALMLGDEERMDLVMARVEALPPCGARHGVLESMALLRQAHQALARGDHAACLGLLDQVESLGYLADRSLRAAALCGLAPRLQARGRLDTARRAAARAVELHAAPATLSIYARLHQGVPGSGWRQALDRARGLARQEGIALDRVGEAGWSPAALGPFAFEIVMDRL